MGILVDTLVGARGRISGHVSGRASGHISGRICESIAGCSSWRDGGQRSQGTCGQAWHLSIEE